MNKTHKITFWLKNIGSFLKDSFIYFAHVDGSIKATGLAYTTLVSIVPLMVLSLGFLSAFPRFAVYLQTLHKFLFRHLVPASANTIQEYVEHFARNAANLSLTGLLFFIASAVLLIFNMESVFNSIWRVKSRRKGLSVLLMYWAVLTLLPPVGGLALATSIYLYSLPYMSYLLKIVGIILPLILDWCAYVFLYMTLPNCKVRFRDAAVGALVAASLFELIKAAFRYYATNFSSDVLVYGILASIPIFLVWLYLCWMITIFGAVISYKLEHHKKTSISL